MTRGVFVTGTDTGVGKTWICLGLLQAFHRRGVAAAAMKPVACGGSGAPGQIHNDDALRLQAACGVELTYEEINPVVFAPPIAPHIAARLAGVTIEVDALADAYRALAGKCAWVVVEGVGGWKVPLNDRHTTADLARALDLPVVLVVGMRLGCLNHALLTAAAIRHDGGTLCGWVANTVDPAMTRLHDNVAALKARLGAPLLGAVPYLPDCDSGRIADCLDADAVIRFQTSEDR